MAEQHDWSAYEIGKDFLRRNGFESIKEEEQFKEISNCGSVCGPRVDLIGFKNDIVWIVELGITHGGKTQHERTRQLKEKIKKPFRIFFINFEYGIKIEEGEQRHKNLWDVLE